MSSTDVKVVVERTYKARVEDIWDLWTTKDGFESWWGPQGFRADVHEIDARSGGTLRYDMVADTPEMIEMMKKMGHPVSHHQTARYEDVTRHKRLVMRNTMKLPNVDAYENDVELDLIVDGGSVRMIVTLNPMHSEEFSKMQLEGFTSQLTKLDKRFSL